MGYRVLPDPRDLDVEASLKVIEFCKANGLDATAIPTAQGDPGAAFQIHGGTIRFRTYLRDQLGRVVQDEKQGNPDFHHTIVSDWQETPLIAAPELFGISLVKVRA